MTAIAFASDPVAGEDRAHLLAVLTAVLLQLGAFSVKLRLFTLAVQVLAVLVLTTLSLIVWRRYRT